MITLQDIQNLSINLLSPKGDSHTRTKEKTCHSDFETENGDITRLEKGENHVKIGFCMSFPYVTGTADYPYMPENGVYCTYYAGIPNKVNVYSLYCKIQRKYLRFETFVVNKCIKILSGYQPYQC